MITTLPFTPCPHCHQPRQLFSTTLHGQLVTRRNCDCKTTGLELDPETVEALERGTRFDSEVIDRQLFLTRQEELPADPTHGVVLLNIALGKMSDALLRGSPGAYAVALVHLAAIARTLAVEVDEVASEILESAAPETADDE